jgi:hypothetical protein
VPVLTDAASKKREEEACVSREVGWNLREEFEPSDGYESSQKFGRRTPERRGQTKAKKYHVHTSNGVASVAESAGCSILAT